MASAGGALTSPGRGGRRGQAVTLAYRAAAGLLGSVPDTVSGPAAVVASRVLLPWRGDEAAMYARHLGRVLGRPLDESETRRRVRQAFASYARYWVEVLSLPSVRGEQIDARMRMVSGWDELLSSLQSDRGVILALPHLGSWEWGGAWLARRGHPMTVVVEVLEPPELFRWFVAQRAAMGLKVVPLGAGAGPVLRELRSGGVVGLVADRDLAGTGIPVAFFGERTTLPGGPATLALRTGATLFPAAVYQGPGRGHTGVVLPALDTSRRGDLRADVTRVTQDLARAFEGLVRRAPEQWFCFQPNWPGDRLGVPTPGRAGRARRRVP